VRSLPDREHRRVYTVDEEASGLDLDFLGVPEDKSVRSQRMDSGFGSFGLYPRPLLVETAAAGWPENRDWAGSSDDVRCRHCTDALRKRRIHSYVRLRFFPTVPPMPLHIGRRAGAFPVSRIPLHMAVVDRVASEVAIRQAPYAAGEHCCRDRIRAEGATFPSRSFCGRFRNGPRSRLCPGPLPLTGDLS
jgi:hypothetical protein